MNTLEAIHALNRGHDIGSDILPEPGMYYTMPAEEYFAIPALNNSTLTLGYRSARDLLAGLEGEIKPKKSAALSLGTYAHTAIFEAESADELFAVEPEWLMEGLTTKDGKTTTSRNSNAFRERYAEWEATLPEGQQVVSREVYETAQRVIEAIRSKPEARAACEVDGKSEVVIRWDIEVEGVRLPMKARIDRLLPTWTGAVTPYDLKTTRRHCPELWAKDAEGYSYHHQEAVYRHGLECLGKQPTGMIYVVAQTEPPYTVSTCQWGEFDRKIARLDYHKHLRMVAHGCKTGEWPDGWGDGTTEVSLSKWAAMRHGDPQTVYEMEEVTI